MKVPVWFAVAVSVLLTDACARGRFGPPLNVEVPSGTRTLKALSVGEREALLQRARIWQPVNTRSLDLAAGPALPAAQRIGPDLTCRFVFPDKPVSGGTPKFLCAVRPDDVVKVKYGATNGEVFAEIAGSRLLWALGFGADRMYPARVICQGCPDEPFTVSQAEWRLGKPAMSAAEHAVFDPAAVERVAPGSPIEVKDFEGWAWPELEKIDARRGGAPRAHVDALKLLAVFIQHADSKPEQQALICAPGGVRRDRSGNESCTSPWLIVKDLGATFGKATAIIRSKMDIEDWSGTRIWRENEPCVGDLPRSLTGSLDNPRISEAGRSFLARRLLMLSDQQIRALFGAARAAQRGGSIDDWVRVFKRKRSEIVDARCPG